MKGVLIASLALVGIFAVTIALLNYMHRTRPTLDIADDVDIISHAFVLALDRLPTRQEAAEASANAKTRNASEEPSALIAYIRNTFPRSEQTDVPAERVKLLAQFDAALTGFEYGRDRASGQNLARAYSELMCNGIRYARIEQWRQSMKQLYGGRVHAALTCVGAYPHETTRCDMAFVNAPDARRIERSQPCAFLQSMLQSPYTNEGVIIFGPETFSNITASCQRRGAARSDVVDTFEPEALRGQEPDALDATEPTPLAGADPDPVAIHDSNVQPLATKADSKLPSHGENAPSSQLTADDITRIVKGLDARIVNIFTCGSESSQEVTRARNMAGGQISPFDAIQNRGLQEMQSVCLRNTGLYTNATDDGKLLPDQKWSIPQERPPVCLSNSPIQVEGDGGFAAWKPMSCPLRDAPAASK